MSVETSVPPCISRGFWRPAMIELAVDLDDLRFLVPAIGIVLIGLAAVGALVVTPLARLRNRSGA